MKRDFHRVALDLKTRIGIQRGTFSAHLCSDAAWLEPEDFESVRLTVPQALQPEAVTKALDIRLARETATRLAVRPATFGSAPLVTLPSSRWRLTRSRPHCEKVPARPLSAFCMHGSRAHVSGGRTNICYLHCSHELQGISLAGFTIFGLSWPVLWRGIKSLSPPFA